MSDLNIRKGLKLMTNFLSSGHIQADRALSGYISGSTPRYYFPFHEVFKGTALGQWKYYKEDRADCVNLFDSRIGSKRLRLLRLAVLSLLANRALHQNTIEVSVQECIETASLCGASEKDTIEILENLQDNDLIRTISSSKVRGSDRVVISRSGAYYLKVLCRTFTYAEQCMYDTAIEDPEIWTDLSDISTKIENMPFGAISARMEMRRARIEIFMCYLKDLETIMFNNDSSNDSFRVMDSISKDVLLDADKALTTSNRWYK